MYNIVHLLILGYLLVGSDIFFVFNIFFIFLYFYIFFNSKYPGYSNSKLNTGTKYN